MSGTKFNSPALQKAPSGKAHGPSLGGTKVTTPAMQPNVTKMKVSRKGQAISSPSLKHSLTKSSVKKP